tara:strand:- start:68 stop:268 length:201 start_codon:yes stop_codon:yes gene_type:complete
MNNSQVINAILILIGGGILIYSISIEAASQYLKIGGLIIIMLGLYRATNYWVATKDDHEEEKENEQ